MYLENYYANIPDPKGGTMEVKNRNESGDKAAREIQKVYNLTKLPAVWQKKIGNVSY